MALAAGVVAVAAVSLFGVWLLIRSLGPRTGIGAAPPPSVTSQGSPRHVGKPKIKGVVVQVLNGTARFQLAATTTQKLAKAGYTTKPPANSPTRRKVTLIAYRRKFVADAFFLRRVYFPHAVLQQSSVPSASGVDITVVLGRDAAG